MFYGRTFSLWGTAILIAITSVLLGCVGREAGGEVNDVTSL